MSYIKANYYIDTLFRIYSGAEVRVYETRETQYVK